MACLSDFLKIFPASHGPRFNSRWLGASPSMAYSILRKTISIITVCGQAQPHQSRPKAAVKMMMPVKNTSTAMAKMIMSCGQNTCPSTTNLRSTMFIRSSGLPLMVANGPANMMASNSQLNQVRQRKNFPATLRG